MYVKIRLFYDIQNFRYFAYNKGNSNVFANSIRDIKILSKIAFIALFIVLSGIVENLKRNLSVLRSVSRRSQFEIK